MTLDRKSYALALAAAVLAASQPSWADDKPAFDEATFSMREVSVFSSDVPGNSSARTYLTRGQYAQCTPEPDPQVKKYPGLLSKQPLFGKVRFASERGKKDRGDEYHFVLDETGPSDSPPDKKPDDKNPEQQKTSANAKGASLLSKITEALGVETSSVDRPLRSEAKSSPYNRLYFDANRDLDLTNDPPLSAMKDPPWDYLQTHGPVERQAFDYLTLEFDFGPGVGKRPLRILPWFQSSDGGKYHTALFVPAVARVGRIELGPQKHDAIMGQPFLITGRYDRSSTMLLLAPVGRPNEAEQYGFASGMLNSMRRIGDQLYTIKATPIGDQLTVRRYTGDMGVVELGPGGRDLKNLSFSGSLRSEEVGLEFGSTYRRPSETKSRTARVPVGDYVPDYVHFEFGPLSISISDNYHSDGKPRDFDRPRNFAIHVRKDKPFVIDFSAKPEVLFASPAKATIVKPGDELQVAAVLVDPSLDAMIRRLDDTRRKEKITYKTGDDQESSYERDQSLDPLVTITDSSGKTVSEGKMPFG